MEQQNTQEIVPEQAAGAEQRQIAEKPLDLECLKSTQFAKLEEKMLKLDKEYPKGLSYEPKPYNGVPDTHLDIGTLLEDDEAKRERANFFVCAICAMVVNGAVECNSCQSLFCATCIEPWAQQNDSCPKKCRGNNAVEFKDLHRYVKQDLMSLKFKCDLPDCKLFKIECEICELACYPNDPERGSLSLEGHDCIEVLKQNLKEARAEIAELKAGGGFRQGAAGSQVIIRSPQGCTMEKTHGIPHGYEGNPRCDACHLTNLQNLEFFFHDSINEYDLCKVCAYKSVNLLKTDENGRFIIRGYGRPLRYDPDSERHHWNNHSCDGAPLFGPNGRCQSSIHYNLANKNQQYMYCEEGNIDICVCCVEKLQY